ncbi:MAG: ectoine/hydroxyectoine ABC transporter permease subunit EhuD [Nitriliruptorales bacterium]|nr:ectoine/hydroxyectoine ABC transporter permease subunit EhuD [Nitriliruptorales bacterium]
MTDTLQPSQTAPPAPEQVEFQPHRRWYRRPEILGPVLVVVVGYVLLIVGVEEHSRFSTRMTAEGRSDFDWMYFWHLVPLMVRGLLVTAKATVLGFTVAAILGFFLALGRRADSRWVSWPTAAVIEFVRSTPLLVQLFFWLAFIRATGLITPEGAEAIGFSRSLLILTLGLGIHYATYCSEAYRAGIDSVPKGQWEASTALNLDPRTKWEKVIIPQAIPNALPALGNFLVAGFKDAPMGFIVGVPGILFFANTVRGEDFRVTEPFFLVGVGFLMASLPAAWLVRRLEERIAYERT